MNWNPVVPPIKDGQDVSAAIVNGPISALTERTQYLYDRLQTTENNAMLLALAQPVANSSGVGQYSVVYFDGVSADNPGLKLAFPALANLASHPFFRGADSAYVYGVVKEDPSNGTADVCLQGLLSGTDIASTLLSPADADFVSGPLYLSAHEAGKLTTTPNGLAIFVAYAKSRDEIYINPNQESLSELFWSFRYAVLDRPAALPSFDGTVWSIGAASSTKVGWVLAADRLSSEELDTYFPAGAPKYFYQLPDPATITTNNPELNDGEIAAATNLFNAFPARTSAFSFLSVNGVLLAPKVSADDKGSYGLNELGLWWFNDEEYDTDLYDDGEFDQPWSSDLLYTLKGSVSAPSTDISLTGADGVAITGLNTTPGFTVNKVIRFLAGPGGTLPSPLASNVDYIIKTVSSGSFTVATAASPGSTITLTTAGTNWYLRWDPSFWAIAKGSTEKRPLMNLQFTKINPDVRQSLVTSLRADPAVSTPAIRIKELSTNTVAATGDLKLKLELPVVNGWDGQATSIQQGKMLKGLYYNSASEQLELSLGNGVSEIRNGGGLRIDVDQSTGVYTISFANAYSSSITDIEPEQARLEYYGLNSYLSMDYLTTSTGFVGKFVLPDQIAAGSGSYLNIIMGLVGKTGGSNSRKKLRFKFDYSVAKLGEPLKSTVTSITSAETDLPLNGAGSYVPYTSFETPSTLFRIPLAELAGKATVNFRIHRLRTEPSSSLYEGAVGMTGIYWQLT